MNKSPNKKKHLESNSTVLVKATEKTIKLLSPKAGALSGSSYKICSRRHIQNGLSIRTELLAHDCREEPTLDVNTLLKIETLLLRFEGNAKENMQGKFKPLFCGILSRMVKLAQYR